MQRFDSIHRSAQTSGDVSHLKGLYQLMVEALDVQKAFEDWDMRSRGGDESSQLYTPRPATRSERSEIDNLESVYPISFSFPTWDAASACISYAMSRIYLNSLLIAIQNAIHHLNISSDMVDTKHLTRSAIACADWICQSIEWFFEDHKRMIGRMVVLAPFEAARGLFAQLCEGGTDDPELDASLKLKARFCKGVTQRIKDGGLPILEG
ncbi:hypothetical protein BKA64DRAFT_375477 [Cadophora sp. MPI-SDFR-AT-0126]|nr:hypothetical protein BKA64DRAFT_375477 [Leotiomycetes sp. MPI-SDFR-AT-0126]